MEAPSAPPGGILTFLAGWAVMAGFLAASALWGEGRQAVSLALAVPLGVVGAFAALSVRYPCRALPPGLVSAWRLASVLALGAGISAGLWITVGVACASVLDRPDFLPGAAEILRAGAPRLAGAGVALHLLACAFHYFVMARDASREAERRELALAALRREAELRALRAQVHPHFLFNSLNAVAALVGADPAEARRVCLLLAEFLRTTLEMGAKDEVPLGEELELGRRYLALERVRFGNRLKVNESAPGDLLDRPVPPLLLQPLLENAIKHGIARRLEGGEICLEIREEGGGLVLAVESPCEEERPEQGRPVGLGMGLANLRARLVAACGEDASLSVQDSGERFRVEIRLPAAGRSGWTVQQPGSSWTIIARFRHFYGEDFCVHPGLTRRLFPRAGAWYGVDGGAVPMEEHLEERPIPAGIRALLVDDEELSRLALRQLLESQPDVTVAGEAGNGFEAVKAVHELKPDLVFLDIQMPRLNGFEVAELLRGEPLSVVFVTAYDEYALEAFRHHPVDYLLKPVAPERLAHALDEVRRRRAHAWEELPARPEGAPLERILVRDGGTVHVLPTPGIDWIQAQDDYVLIRAGGKSYLKAQPLSELEKELDPRRFVRVHRSHILNVERLSRLEPQGKETWSAVLADGTVLPVSRSGYARLRALL